MPAPDEPLSCAEKIHLRAQLYQNIREFFSQRQVHEVETPIFSRAGNPDPAIHSLMADLSPYHSMEVFAHTSPEFAMKRLLAAGSGSIYQICKVFRLGEVGRLHNPEFTMLEWYRPGFTYHQLMQEVEQLLRHVGVNANVTKHSYVELFYKFFSIDVFKVSASDLALIARNAGLEVVGMEDQTQDAWQQLLLTHLIEPELKREGIVFIYDFPASQAALASLKSDDSNVAERFECYVNGVELANGYQELTDGEEYLARFTAQNTRRQEMGDRQVVIDQNLVAAIKSGFPHCSGVALGIDRLLMQLANVSDIRHVLNFDYLQA